MWVFFVLSPVRASLICLKFYFNCRWSLRYNLSLTWRCILYMVVPKFCLTIILQLELTSFDFRPLTAHIWCPFDLIFSTFLLQQWDCQIWSCHFLLEWKPLWVFQRRTGGIRWNSKWFWNHIQRSAKDEGIGDWWKSERCYT